MAYVRTCVVLVLYLDQPHFASFPQVRILIGESFYFYNPLLAGGFHHCRLRQIIPTASSWPYGRSGFFPFLFGASRHHIIYFRAASVSSSPRDPSGGSKFCPSASLVATSRIRLHSQFRPAVLCFVSAGPDSSWRGVLVLQSAPCRRVSSLPFAANYSDAFFVAVRLFRFLFVFVWRKSTPHNLFLCRICELQSARSIRKF